MMSKLVYLAGPIKGLNYEGCTSWREYAAKELAKDGIEALSPMRAKDFLKDLPLIVERQRFINNPLTSDAGVTTQDIWDLGVVMLF